MSMVHSQDQIPIHVGQLRFCCSRLSHPSWSHPIPRDTEFDIGKNDVEYASGGVKYPTISAHHLRFRCIVYTDDEDSVTKISPMVYFRVLSSKNPILLFRAGLNNTSSGEEVCERDGDFLLNDGDVMQLATTLSATFQVAPYFAATSDGLDIVQTAEIKRFADQFLVQNRKLGAGGQASVFVAVKQRTRQVACKVVRGSMRLSAITSGYHQNPLHWEQGFNVMPFQTNKQKALAREVNILRDLDHPNIIRLEKVICATFNTYMFEELVTGGDLMSYMGRQSSTELQAAVIVRQLLKAVEYLHDNGVVHRDIKPENVLMTSWRDGGRLVLTDFGQARTLEDSKAAAAETGVFRMQTCVGTMGYTAPEVYLNASHDQQGAGYTKAIDIYSIGCIAATLLTNELLFRYTYDEIENGDRKSADLFDVSIVDKAELWAPISRKPKSFVKACANHDESQRPTAKRALLLDWFTKHHAAEFEALYDKSIQEWRPRESACSVQLLDTTDVTLAEARNKRTKRMAEEVKAHDFHAQATNMVIRPPISSKRRARTPLPEISEDTEASAFQRPENFHTQSFEGSLQRPASAPDRTQSNNRRAKHHDRQLSIEQFAPPQTQLSIHAVEPVAPSASRDGNYTHHRPQRGEWWSLASTAYGYAFVHTNGFARFGIPNTNDQVHNSSISELAIADDNIPGTRAVDFGRVNRGHPK